MKLISKLALAAATLLPATLNVGAAIEGSLDPPSVVAEWSNSSTYPKIIDINFSDEMWPGQTWTGETGMDCPEYADGGYVNTVIEVPANGGTEIKYPVLFHNCIFANKKVIQRLCRCHSSILPSVLYGTEHHRSRNIS